MNIACFLTVMLLLSPTLSQASDPMDMSPQTMPLTTNTPPQTLKADIAETTTNFNDTKHCFADKAKLMADLTETRASLKAEFKGNIPAPFNDTLWTREERIAKWHTRCSQQYEELGKRFQALHDRFRSLDLSNPGIKKQKAGIDALHKEYLKMQPTTKQYNRPKPKKGK